MTRLFGTRTREEKSSRFCYNEPADHASCNRWNNNASIFFVDQPVGVGYSYAEYGIQVNTTEEAAKDIYAFVFLFLEHFSHYQGRPLHLSGESYGGRYLPVRVVLVSLVYAYAEITSTKVFASEIVDSNARAVKAGYEPINLKSVVIGNGLTSFAL